MRRYLVLLMVGMLAVPSVWAQHDEHTHTAEPDTVDAERRDVDSLPEQEARMEMSSTVLPGLPMQRDGSGTSWHPDASPMYGVHAQAGSWSLMFHGNLFLRYNAQDVFESGTRGDRQFDMPNWFMLMGQRNLSRRSQLGLRAMVSLDPLTVGGSGYPLLFQTGESYEDEPLIDRQHPHDFFSELALVYGQSLGERAGFFAYFGLPGEPALGPPAFMHRPSALRNPDSPLGHHWQDATHIVFGVATLGFRYDMFKLDGSIFTGREPDEERFGIDRPRFDSYSLRLAANPNERWALQVSRGFLKEPEWLHPDEDQWRTAASAMHIAPVFRQGRWSASFVWGMNQRVEAHEEEPGEEGVGALHSFLLESDLQLGRQAFYGRAEWVQKPAEELGLEQFGHSRVFDIGALTLGMARELVTVGNLRLELGGHAIFYRVPEDIQPVYGSSPVSLEVYLRFSPGLMRMQHAGRHEHAEPAHRM